ncbi:hypothetical protein BD309DRAFT_945592, partial [Dichomitus squalens]
MTHELRTSRSCGPISRLQTCPCISRTPCSFLNIIFNFSGTWTMHIFFSILSRAAQPG